MSGLGAGGDPVSHGGKEPCGDGEGDAALNGQAKDLKGLSFNYFSMVVMSLYEVDLLLYVAFCDQWHTFVRSLPKSSSCLVCYLRVVKN